MWKYSLTFSLPLCFYSDEFDYCKYYAPATNVDGTCNFDDTDKRYF